MRSAHSWRILKTGAVPQLHRKAAMTGTPHRVSDVMTRTVGVLSSDTRPSRRARRAPARRCGVRVRPAAQGGVPRRRSGPVHPLWRLPDLAKAGARVAEELARAARTMARFSVKRVFLRDTSIVPVAARLVRATRRPEATPGGFRTPARP
ncbi:conserved hypothetical protein [Streptomyces sviceus ATCC 29083]|uniref:Uncharacterized protein n=1 Tax=Streptomyces sviceus (strain ATCC 29083 / DSM 924 / JCM 4929 / NBRC 13980 / NCIMB 11184 / NRRL 5439 / UC 5370) TaxID=463191 RepID=B5I3V7_STRX2|nr:conserved hypothetical protein [Streptomyces sviceus ATCC 29083]